VRPLLLVALLQGCTAVHAAGELPTGPAPRFVPPPVEFPAHVPGDCTDSVELGPGESRPCRSVSMSPAKWRQVLAKLDQVREFTEPALVQCQNGRDEDRASCAAVVEGTVDLLKTCRQRQPAAFAAGFGAGAATCGAVVGAVGAATR
jgi:hypothetical protein